MNPDYVLRGAEEGAKRLALLSRVKWPTTHRLLIQIGLRAGMRCLDLGCGNGHVAIEMASIVSPDGSVVGIDVDEIILDIARGDAARRALPATFYAGSALEIDQAACFDLVYARFLLTHLREPERGVRSMLRAARPGGTVAVEDIDFTGSFCRPRCSAFERYVELYQAVVRHNGGDPAIGPRLFEMFLDAGLEDVNLDVLMLT